MTKSDFLFLLGSSAARGAGLYQAMPARRHHGPHGHRRQHQHGQGHRDQVGYKSFPKMDLDIWRCISLLGVELFLRVMVTWWWKARSSTNEFETLTLARSELFVRLIYKQQILWLSLIMFVFQGATRSSWQDLAEAQSARQVAADRQIHTGW